MGCREARIKAGKKVSDVVRFMGVTDAAVYQWETGVTKPKSSSLLKLAQFYNCTVDELLKEGSDSNGKAEDRPGVSG